MLVILDVKIDFRSWKKFTRNVRVDIAKHAVKVRDHAPMPSSDPGSILVILSLGQFWRQKSSFDSSFLVLQTDSIQDLTPQFESKCIQLAGKIQTSENKLQTKKL